MLNWIKRRNLSPKIIFIVASLVLGVLYLKYKYVYFWGAYMLKIVLGVVLLMCLFLWSYRRNFNNRILLFLGGISYEIYLFHTTFYVAHERLFCTTGVSLYSCYCGIYHCACLFDWCCFQTIDKKVEIKLIRTTWLIIQVSKFLRTWRLLEDYKVGSAFSRRLGGYVNSLFVSNLITA